MNSLLRDSNDMVNLTNKEESQEMMAIWPDIVRDITDMAKNLNIPDVAKWLEKVLEYNVLGRKKTCALTLIHTYKLLTPNDQCTEDNIRLVRILAWCAELMKAYILITDDIEDQSLLRQSQPCWYRYNNIGAAAINDGILLENAIYYIIKKYFKGKDYYVNILETFHDVMYKTLLGQCLNLFSSNFGKKPNLNLFTMDRYSFIVQYKASYYMYILPVTVAMHLAGIKDPEIFRQAIPILIKMGHFFQVQDDYMNCFGDSKICGKDDTDIKKGKCTWFVVVALRRATLKQRKILEECYGVSDLEKVEQVKQLFANLNLLDAYFTYEKKTYNLIIKHIQQISCGLPYNLFSNLLGQLYCKAS